MIDKLELVVPNNVDFAGKFSALYSDIRGSELDPFRPSREYTSVGDLRPFGISAIVHLWSKRGKMARHKLELIDCGSMSMREMEHEVAEVFDANPAKLEVRRLDAAADVENLTVPWFHDRVRVQFKQWAAKIGKEKFGGPTEVEFSEMGKREMQTLYYGKRPNCLRIYNKTAEYMHQYKYLVRKVSPDAEIPTFEQCFGVSPDSILTRIERQMHGAKLPVQLQTVSRVKANAADFDPFTKIKFIAGGRPEPNIDSYDLDTWAAGMYWRQQWELQGAHWVIAKWNRHRNASRYLRRFRDFLPEDPFEGQGEFDLGDKPAEQTAFPNFEKFDARSIYERYRESVHRQLAA